MDNPIYLSQAQIDQIQSLYQAGLNAQGNYSDIYKLIGDMLPPGDVQNWFRGAEQANGGNGAYSAMIRGYSKRQMELRGIGASYSDTLMQAASNKVAENAIEDILDLDGDTTFRKQSNGSWLFPTVDEIASNDAIGVGEVLFASLLAGDTARGDSFNAGWAGAILFSPLDSAQTWRLTQGGGVELNSLDDFKNILFAYDALGTGLKDAFAAGFDQPFKDLGILGMTAWEGGIPDLIAIGFSKLSTLLPPSAQALGKLIEQVGVNAVLDMLISTSQGKPLHGLTTDANFAANANAYFNALTPDVIQGLTAELMPTTAGAMVALAKTDVNARAALAALSSVSVEINTATAANLDLYDPVTGTGELTNQYLTDRAAMLAWKMQYDSGILDSDDALFPGTLGESKPYTEEWDAWSISGDWDFIDRSLLVGGLPFTLTIDGLDPVNVTDNHQIVFGTGNAEALIGNILTRVGNVKPRPLIHKDDENIVVKYWAANEAAWAEAA